MEVIDPVEKCSTGNFIGNKRAWKITGMVGRLHGSGCRGCEVRKFNVHTREN